MLIFIGALLLATLACTVPGIDSGGPVATPTPQGDTLSFIIPAYTTTLDPGETVPGTRLTYVGRAEDGYQVTIDGLTATKRTGDSFIWNGVLAPGVYANYNLRITTAVFGALPVAGPVEIIIFNPEPAAQPLTPEILNSPARYSNVVINYNVPVGRTVPGTTLVFEEMVVQGEGQQVSQQARLSGLGTYPYFALGDSLVWTGQLRDNVYVRYSLRVASLSESNLRLAGTAELWIVTP